jgi:hypothetical protein
MTHDPIWPLADIGRRALQTTRYLTTSHAPDEPLESYESRFGDPLVSLSGLCKGVLERLEASPVAQRPEHFPYGPESRSVHARDPGSAFPTSSRTGVPAARGYESASVRRETRVKELPHTPGLDGTSTFEGSRRSIDGPVPYPEEPDYGDPWEATVPREPGEEAPQMEDPEARPGPADARRAPRARDVWYPVRRSQGTGHPAGSKEEPDQEEIGDELPARKEEPEAGQPGSAGARGSDAPWEKLRRAAESGFQQSGSRLTASSERLAAMLRSHVAQPAESPGDEEVIPPRDDERGGAHFTGRARTQPADGVEEIMDRIADELETEFVRTYGISGV